MAQIVEIPVARQLLSCDHQAGGHKSKDMGMHMCVDGQGLFYKPFQSGPRSEREMQFYASVSYTVVDVEPDGMRPHAAYPASNGAVPDCMLSSRGPKEHDVTELLAFVPKYWGRYKADGHSFIVLEDFCADLIHPCVLDCKMGFTTVYDWADEEYKSKNSVKDASTSTSSVGFRVSGMQRYCMTSKENIQADKDWCLQLNKHNIGNVFSMFASSSGGPSLTDLYCHPECGVLVQLRQFQTWCARQSSYQFYQASIIIIYDASAATVQEAKVRVKFVDFAHTFRMTEERPDENLFNAVTSLISVIEGVCSTACEGVRKASDAADVK
ncbi:hypothetical protein CEUSTIGMA_g3686.t1 [Chlamydomonas eustigma]|uniref:Inositol polyphosphate multikinase n=1 Tax=Chlamydomonas eustigma TaxID=1157962 RepID=A0A250X026_9CHLO|nr:hypothetical protein CEUSTIGMA_g3686.t1 [Chlamydomonas eustigma]|eukprot:GAX76242.1 hypothetical protein CEUSTIGMA_g3686.t1 [Chlamydomonas eustigma]